MKKCLRKLGKVCGIVRGKECLDKKKALVEKKALFVCHADKRSCQRHYKHHKPQEIRYLDIILHDKRIEILVDTKLETSLVFTIRVFYFSLSRFQFGLTRLTYERIWL